MAQLPRFAANTARKAHWPHTSIAAAALLLSGGCTQIQQQTLFFPTHHARTNGLTAWKEGEKIIGYSRPAATEPETVWLFLHGNAGQAADRVYALGAFSNQDAIYLLEYPGYGLRPGETSRSAIDKAALDAYRRLRRSHPNKPVCVVAESIGSGPACVLAGETTPPDKLVLIVPFDTLKGVAADHMGHLPVGFLLGSVWDNVAALSQYRGPVEIFGAENDEVIPISRARHLAASLPQSVFHTLAGGHNDWPRQREMKIRNP